MAAETAIASTQKQGQGDATILGNNTPNVINTLLGIGAKEKSAKAQSKLLNQKQEQENKSKFYQGLTGLKDKVWYRDIPEITQRVNDVVDKAIKMQKSGINPFDPSNTAAYTELFGDVEKIGLLQGASKSAEKKYEEAYKLINNDKDGIYDKGKLIDAAESYFNIPSIEERAKYEIQPVYAPVKFDDKLKNFDAILKEQFDMAKVYNDKNLVNEVNTQIEKVKTNIVPTMEAAFEHEIKLGMTTPEEVKDQVAKRVQAWQEKAFYNPMEQKKLDLAATKEANQERHRGFKRDMEEKKFSFTKAQSTSKPTEVEDLFKTAKEGGSISENSFAGLVLTETGTNTKFTAGKSRLIKSPTSGKIIGVATERFTIPADGSNEKPKKYKSDYITYFYDPKGNDISSTTQLYKEAMNKSISTKVPVTNTTVDDSGNQVVIDENQLKVGDRQTNTETQRNSNKNSTAKSGGSGVSTPQKKLTAKELIEKYRKK